MLNITGVCMDDFSDIIKKIAAAPSADLPSDFTAKVMTRVLKEPRGVLDRFWQIIPFPQSRMFSSAGCLSPSATKGECAFCYILTGCFYAIMGGYLLSRLGDIDGPQIITNWIMLQPFFIIVTSLWLFGLGTFLYFAGRPVTPYIKIGSLIFIAAFLLNGLFSNNLPSLIVSFFTVLLNSTAVIMGLILYKNVSVYASNLD
jgi:hypothetical protein